MADVFLSYARPDEAVARSVARELEAAGRSVWYDSELSAHQAYADVIAKELEAAGSVLVLWSRPAVESQWVRSEANRARELGKLVQARLDDSRLPMPFDQIQCADLARWRRGREHSGWSQVRKGIDALLSAPALPAPAGLDGRHVSRRNLLVGGTAAAGALAVGAGWWTLSDRRSKQRIPPDVVAMMDQARVALWQSTPEGQNQSIGLYRQVVSEHPDIAEAWGGLSMAYSTAAHWRRSDESQMFWDRARSTGQRALALDPKNISGMLGLARAKPNLGNWLQIERDLRSTLALSPKDPEIRVMLADILSIVGRNREALKYVDVSLPGGPTPGLYVMRARMLWAAGRQEELDSLLDEASRLYPTHFGVWFTKFYAYMLGGRPDAALALAADLSSRPTGIETDEIDGVVKVAKAIKSKVPAEVDAVTKTWLSRARAGAGYAENAAQFLSALGRPDQAFAVLRAYYFSEGFDCGENRFKGTIGAFTPHDDRQTFLLFNPAFGPLRGDARFAKLVSDLRLADYWRRAKALPDYRSTADRSG